jgi:hypothetical protein
MLRLPEPDDLVVPEEDFSPRVGLFTLWGLAAVPRLVPWVFAGASGFRMARGLADVAFPGVPPLATRPVRPSRASPVAPSFRSMTRLPSRGWTEIFVPAGLRLRLRLVRVIPFRPFRESPLSALAERWGSLRCSRRTTVRAREP